MSGKPVLAEDQVATEVAAEAERQPLQQQADKSLKKSNVD
jgi:hypothetical protein